MSVNKLKYNLKINIMVDFRKDRIMEKIDRSIR